MPTKVFLTGATGYIGGDALYVIANAHPDWEITSLVRNSSKGAKVARKYPEVRLIYGDLDSAEVIKEEARKADIVYHFANCDHEGSAEAIAQGLSQRTRDGPAYWIHTSGSLIIGWETIEKGCYGELLPKVYDDWENVNELVSLPDKAAHRVVDKIVLASSANHPKTIKTAIVCPPTIYGPGRGPDNQVSQQVYKGARTILERKGGFLPTEAKNIWHEVHVQDLSDLYLLLGEAAASGDGKATWDQEGYYLAENGSFVWGDIFKSITKIAHEKGLLTSDETPVVSEDDLIKVFAYGPWVWATNSRGVSLRGKNLLGWKPHQRSLMDELPDIVELEAKGLGLM